MPKFYSQPKSFWRVLFLGLLLTLAATWMLFFSPLADSSQQSSEFKVTAPEVGLVAELEVPLVSSGDPTAPEFTPLVTIPIEVVPPRRKTPATLPQETPPKPAEGLSTNVEPPPEIVEDVPWSPPTDPLIPEGNPDTGEDDGTSELPVQPPEPPVLRPTPDPGREPSHPTPDNRTPRRKRR